MTPYPDRLLEIAKNLNLDPKIIHDYMWEELNPMKQQMFLGRNVAQNLLSELGRNSEGVFFALVSPKPIVKFAFNLSNDYIGLIVSGMMDVIQSHSYHLQYRTSNIHLISVEYFLHILQKYPDAGVVALIPAGAEMLAEACHQLQRPCVLLDYDPEAAPGSIHTLNGDGRAATRDAVQYLFELGHQRIGYLTGVLSFLSASERLAGYRDAYAANGLPVDESLIVEGNWQLDFAEQAIEQFMALDPPPTAIACANDLMAIGLVTQAIKRKINVPKTLSIIGFDDIPMAMTMTPTLTTIQQPGVEMGKYAGHLMIDLMTGQEMTQRDHQFSLNLVKRQSTAPLAHR